jgi:hypothetical protein
MFGKRNEPKMSIPTSIATPVTSIAGGSRARRTCDDDNQAAVARRDRSRITAADTR